MENLEDELPVAVPVGRLVPDCTKFHNILGGRGSVVIGGHTVYRQGHKYQ
jgi:hypothetical protein